MNFWRYIEYGECWFTCIVGFVFLLLSIKKSEKLTCFNSNKFKVKNKEGFIKSQQKLVFAMGLSWFVISVVSILNILSMSLYGSFFVMIISLHSLWQIGINKKYLIPIDL